MQQKKSHYDGQLWRERAIDLYVESLDRGDLDGVAAVLEAAMDDPKLERMLQEVNLAYQEEEQLTPIATDAQVVRDLIQQHLHSAFNSQEQSQSLNTEVLQVQEKPLTVGDVAKRLQETNRVPYKEQDILKHFLGSSLPLPVTLSMSAIQELAAQLNITASDRFLDLFRNTAIMLSMGRSHSQALQAARNQKGRPTPSKPIQKPPKLEDEQ